MTQIHIFYNEFVFNFWYFMRQKYQGRITVPEIVKKLIKSLKSLKKSTLNAN